GAAGPAACLPPPRPRARAARADRTSALGAQDGASPARGFRALGGQPRDLARPLSLRRRTRTSKAPRLRAPLLDDRRDARLDAARRPRLASPADDRRARCARGDAVRGGT